MEVIKKVIIPKLKIEVIEEDGKWFDITNRMYWFEENGVRDINTMNGNYRHFPVRIWIDDELVYESGIEKWIVYFDPEPPGHNQP
jgi:hypothetical protein